MSLETVIQENTNAIRELVAALAKGVPTTSAQVAAVVAEAPPAAKAEAQATNTKKEAVKAAPTEDAPAAGQKPEALTQMTGAEAEKALHGHANNPADAPTYQATADAVTKLARTKGRDAAIAVLTNFGAAKLPDVKPEQFAAVIAACEEAGA
ncbi:hypothetical protein [Oryzomicrobium sp.]|uniref:hypothetical protein n=1 Tax=Oryzomicrobium sp. TaxID=1911578 RepID=UPI002FE01383